MQIRRYRPSDAAAVRRLHFEGLDRMEVNRPGPWDADLDRIEEEYLDGGDFLIVEVDGEIAAMGGLRAVGSEVGELKRLRVAKGFQRRGLGEVVARALIARAREVGLNKVVLDTTTRQPQAQRLYAKLGFMETGRTIARDLEIVFYEREV